MLALLLGTGLLAPSGDGEAPAQAPTEVIWPAHKERVRHLQPYRSRRIVTPVDDDDQLEPLPANDEPPRAKPQKAAPKSYDGPSAYEIANAAILDASRRLSQEIAAKAALDEKTRAAAALKAQAEIKGDDGRVELAAFAVRRSQDEEALIALLLAM